MFRCVPGPFDGGRCVLANTAPSCKYIPADLSLIQIQKAAFTAEARTVCLLFLLCPSRLMLHAGAIYSVESRKHTVAAVLQDKLGRPH